MIDRNEHPKSLVGVLKKGFLIAIVSASISIAFIVSYISYIEFTDRSAKFEQEYKAARKEQIKDEVNRVVSHIRFQSSVIERKVRVRIKSRVYDAHSIAAGLYKKFNGKVEEKTLKKMIVEALRPLRFFDGDGYYYIGDLNGVMMMHALVPSIEGVNRLDVANSKGRYLARDLIDIAKNKGEGYLLYGYRSFKNRKEEIPKIGFVKLFEPYGWYIGTGDYLDSIRGDVQREILEYISKIKFGTDGYLFVVNYDGVVLTSSQPKLIGKNILNMEDPNGLRVVEEELKIATTVNEGFLNYLWNKPSTGKISPKVSFIKGVDEWRWMIGAGVYIDDVDMLVAEQTSLLKKDLVRRIIFIALISLAASLMLLFVVNRVARRFSVEINLLLDFFKSHSSSSDYIDVSEIEHSELKQIAHSANLMLEKQKKSDLKRTEAQEQLRSSESNLREAQRISQFGSWELKARPVRLTWSDEVYRIFGLEKDISAPDNEILDSSIHPDDRGMVDDAMSRSLEKHTPYDVEYRIRLDDGAEKMVHVHVEHFYDDSGELVRTAGSIQDITDIRLKEEILKRSQKMDALGKLTGGIAHDYNNMLAIIIGYSALMKPIVSGDATSTGYINQIYNAGERAKSLTDKLLNFSKSKPSVLSVVDVADELVQQQQMLEKTLTARIQLVMNLADDIWPVQLDRDDLNNAVLNIAINSSHAIHGHGVLRITAANKTLDKTFATSLKLAPGEYVQLSIADNGMGMDSDTIARVFDPFFSTKGEKGTGLGMSQVYGFVQRCGGDISVKSEIGIGTEFTLYFPHYAASLPVDHQPQALPNVVKGSEVVLVVDDEPALCMLASAILEDAGYNVLTAGSAIEALQRLESEKVDLVFSDVIMPKMNGYQLADEISRKYPEIVVQLVSGYSSVKDLPDNELVSNMKLLHKPYSANELLQLIRERLDS